MNLIFKKTSHKNTAFDLHDVVLFNRDAELAETYLKTGSKVYIEGKIKSYSSEIDGKCVKKSEIHAIDMQMLDPPPSKRINEVNDNKEGSKT